jgi:putative Ca2+/H+ antiporter (TMEM165/GDT1 family)
LKNVSLVKTLSSHQAHRPELVNSEELAEVLSAFSAGLLLIGISELGDKTFFIAAILAMRYSRRLIFIGVIAALATMTVLSVLMGQAASLLPVVYIHYAKIILFVGFGLKLLYEARQMPAQSCDTQVIQEAIAVVDKTELQLPKQQIQMAICLEAFILTFLAEWGDRTQIATIALASGKNPVGVTTGAILAHAICAALAVIGGRMLAGHISERTLTFCGGCLFLIFGVVACLEGG